MLIINRLLRACSVVVLSVAIWPALAQTYPSRPVRLIVPFEPGGGTDIVARQISQGLAERLGQSVVVENRGGAGAILGTSAAARAAPDGYTIFLGQIGPLAINPYLYAKLPYDPVKDFEPVTFVGSQPLVLVVNPAVPANTVAEFVALAKARPGQLNFSSAGKGSMGHLAGEYFKSITGAPIVHIPYKSGGPAVSDLVGGQVQLTFNVIPTLMPLIKAGKLRALGVSYASPALPDVPVMEREAPDFNVGSWIGILVPAQTPRAIIARLNTEIRAVLATPAVRRQFDEQGVQLNPGTPEEFAAFIKKEQLRWSGVVKTSGAAAE